MSFLKRNEVITGIYNIYDEFVNIIIESFENLGIDILMSFNSLYIFNNGLSKRIGYTE